MIEHVRITPVDVLYFRGNRLFGQSAGHSEALMPPWPSAFAGALRSRMLVDHPGALSALSARRPLPGPLEPVLGSIETPGSFRVAHVALAAGERLVFPLPADLMVVGPPEQDLGAVRATPASLVEVGVITSASLPCVPNVTERAKPKAGYWIDAEGLAAYQAGALRIAGAHLVPISSLWETDSRLGIGLDAERRTAAEGMLHTSEAIALAAGVSFVVGVGGANGALPREGLLRLGGDGRGASVAAWVPRGGESLPWAFLPRSDRFSVVLAAPGIFTEGWRLPGLREVDGVYTWTVDGLEARLVAASVPRPEVVSGWDLTRPGVGGPKPAERVVPRGAVYWFERVAGDLAVLERLLEEGLWPLVAEPDRTRRAEGYNAVWFSAWTEWRNDVRE